MAKFRTGDGDVNFTAEVPTQPIEKIRPEVSAIADRAKTMIVTSQAQADDAGGFLQSLKAMRKKVSDLCDPVVKAAHAAHKAATQLRSSLDEPLDAAEKEVKRKVADYFTLQEQQRREEERRRAAELAEEARLRSEQDAMFMDVLDQPEAAESIRAEPLQVPAVIIAPGPKPQGISTAAIWKAKIVDEKLIPREFLMADHAKINSYARTMKADAKIPGVEFYDETSVRVR